METLFFAKLLGLYFLIVGLVVMFRRKSVMPAVSEIVKNRSLLLIVALVELLAGLSIIINYTEVTLSLVGIISLVGWMLVVEGIVYLALPAKYTQKLVRSFNKPSWYVGGGILAALMGAYLAALGFGLIV